jgi:HEAT repeat protein
VPGREVPLAVGDAVVHAMNDPEPAVRRWAMDALGWMRYERAVSALTERFTFYGKGPDAAAALHALARIASPASAPLFREQMQSRTPGFRLIAIEGLARIGGAGAAETMAAAAAAERHPAVQLAIAFGQILTGGPGDIHRIAGALPVTDTAVQARVYLAEIGMSAPDALHPLLASPDAWLRQGTVALLGVSQRPDQIAAIEPLLRDAEPAVIEAASEALRRLRAYAALAPAPAP